MLGTGSTARAQSGCAEIHVVTEKAPEVQGGLEAFRANVRYPEAARAAGVEGRVFVQFIVDTRGRVVNPAVTRGIRADLDAEAVRVIRAARFTPGRQRGRAVCVQMSLPITFRADMDAPAASSAPSAVTNATATVEKSVSSVTTQVDETTASVNSAASSVAQGVEDTKASVSSTTEEVSETASSLKETLGGLFGKKRRAEEAPADAATHDAPAHPAAAAAAFAAGDIVRAKIDNLALLAQPANEAATVTKVLMSDQLIYMGREKGDFIFVQTSKGQGWINKLLVVKQ